MTIGHNYLLQMTKKLLWQRPHTVKSDFIESAYKFIYPVYFLGC
ncbi:hypothetical protein ETAE_1935 [Edwardsiella piscicida]|uniref:Uncharacterized protein n=2 Tax=Edwardsiella TaxID=635 RepID=A0A0H3DV81_EDWTF|nr:hypothetical protein ETAE_1935 [Edwardsiella tarda EIB202]ADM41854.1 hypothetical protein ETAF_1746 [Edwardsiella tarda FL6-60]